MASGPRLLSWVLGIALLVALIIATFSLSEGREFVHLAERATPWKLLVAVLLQSVTYVAQGGVWRLISRDGHVPLSRARAFELSLVKLFADQALPSAGLSSSVLVAKALESTGEPVPTARATVIVNLVSYHLAYVMALAGAITLLATEGVTNAYLFAAATLFLLFALGLSAAVLAATGRACRLPSAVRRMPGAAAMLEFLAGTDARLARSPRLLAKATVLQTAIVLLDAATVWILIDALGARASFAGVFASFMIASLFRTIGIVPGGLGTFEATSVVTLRLTGVPVPVALSATLLFRGLSFWLPMLPGYWFSRRAVNVPSGSDQAVQPGLPYWALDPDDVLKKLGASARGLTSADADARLARFGPNELRERKRVSRLDVLIRQLRSPLLLLLVFAAGASALTGEWLDSAIVVTIVVATVGIGYSREYNAQTAAEALSARVRVRAEVLRDGRVQRLPVDEIVPGDVVQLAAGSLVPADSIVLEATDCFVSEAVLTGESFPVQKKPGRAPASAGLATRTNCVYLGTNVRSGTARCLVVRTGSATEFGTIAHRLTLQPPETEFDRGIRRFGYLLTSAMLVLVLLIFVAHVLRSRPPVETLLFAVALAVGLSPELLPAILGVSLATGAQMMARHGVLVRRLNAIENLGSADVLCTDKTGTLTEGVVRLEGAYDAAGRPSEDVLELAACNAALETGIASPLDDAILAARTPDLANVMKLAEIPFDFVRKRVSVVIRDAAGSRLVTKGAFHHVLEACARLADGSALDRSRVAALEERYAAWSGRGVRVLAVAETRVPDRPSYGRDSERDLTFLGFVTFFDRPKERVAGALDDLARLGVSVKVITGDNALVTRSVASLIGMRGDRLLTGRQLDDLNDEALWHAAERTDLFVEVDPNQKERIILSLKKMGHVVAFLGDGVNDAPAMHAADTSLSVEQAVDVAREAADFVLLDRSLDVIRRGIEEGRRTFANTLKYVLITTSANLGNMVSMAAASLFLPFLPLTAGQILLNNFLSDIPAVGLAADNVDRELVDRPRRWDIRFVGRYMVEFGLLSSVFDWFTFAVLLRMFHATVALFQTAWFVESLLTELLVALVVRTRRPFYQSRPGRLLMLTTAGVVVLALTLPVFPFAPIFGFVPLPAPLLLLIVLIACAYVAATEMLKKWFYRPVSGSDPVSPGLPRDVRSRPAPPARSA